MDDDDVQFVRSKRNLKNAQRTALLEKIADARAARGRKAPLDEEQDAGSMFWPGVGENDARLFEDSVSDEECASSVSTARKESTRTKQSDTSVLHESLTSSAPTVRDETASSVSTASEEPVRSQHSEANNTKVPGRRRLCKVKERHSPLPMASELAAAQLVELPSDSNDSHSLETDDGVDYLLCEKLGSMSLTMKQQISTTSRDTFESANSADYGSATSSLAEVSKGGTDDVLEISSSSLSKKSNKSALDLVLGEGRWKFILPGNVSSILYEHQHEGLRWLWRLHLQRRGGILGDDMGLGKTMQIAAFLCGLFHSKLIKRALIVAPKTLIPHWGKELNVVGLGRKVKDYSGTSISVRESNLDRILQAGGVLLTTYDIVRHNTNALKGEYNFDDDDVTWDYVILDEGHLIKNPSTQRAKSLKEIPSAHRIIISGTPIQNNLREMWALFDFCYPELLGDRKECVLNVPSLVLMLNFVRCRFKAKYETMILSGNDKNATDRQKRIGAAVAQELQDRFAPYFLRRLKKDVFPNTGEETQQLAKKNDIIVWLRLSQRQRQMYTAFLRSETAQGSLAGSAKGSALAALTILKKICDHPLLLTKRATDDVVEGLEYLDSTDIAAAEAMRKSLAGLAEPEPDSDGNKHSCKIVFLMALLENLVQEGHRTLVFAQTLKMLDIIQEEITKRRYSFCRIDGKTKGSERQRIVEDFQTDGCTVSIFLLTSQVGGLGLTLTAADRVVIVDPAWNPSKDNQSVDRAYRIGQLRDVIVYRLMTSGTLEEKIYRKQVFKGGLMKVATERAEQFRYFSQQDFRELLTVPKTGFDISPTQQQLYEEHASQFEVDEELAKHIKFLERQGIAGVSHHDLLFSKAAPELPPAADEEVSATASVSRMAGSLSSKLKNKQVEDYSGSAAYQPQSNYWKGTQRVNLVDLDDSQMNVRHLQDNINRLSSMLSNRSLVSKLPDGGENIRKKMKDLEIELEEASRAREKEIVDVDEFASAFDKLHVIV
ncbi:protein CHROMATIN REMODELING 24 isoform X1 [Selaginella moellendorffii]|uniref:protein CHROMATIN REMODELING 24 isoform X1 n=1 Tax=Selaginella moellendorffii TaxID=88036 RepID=UPI000D1C8157|nr:protein CHROMATIN REMODELING 24 isoform X1 [Selaginella moellendorffii]|eukprot:XP_024537177.1 protein CHROMATIN REMODELING 24 isoform X1 [Selaginella moellendorffii]